MSKKGVSLLGLALLSLFGCAFVSGNSIYQLAVKRRREDGGNGEKALPHALRAGRLFVKNYEKRSDLYLDAVDFYHLHGVMLKPEEAAPSLYCILFHAEHEDHTSMGVYAKHYLENGYTVLLPDLRGCGESDGTSVGYGYDDRLDVSVWVYRIIKEDPDARIVLHGVSSGAAAVINACAEHLPDNVIAAVADSSFTDASSFFGHFIKYGTDGFLPVRIRRFLFRAVTLLRAGYDIEKNRPVDAVKNSKTPTLFLHGDDDKLIPVRMCNELYTAATCAREYATFMNADHLLSVVKDPVHYWKKVDDFIDRFYSAS